MEQEYFFYDTCWFLMQFRVTYRDVLREVRLSELLKRIQNFSDLSRNSLLCIEVLTATRTLHAYACLVFGVFLYTKDK